MSLIVFSESSGKHSSRLSLQPASKIKASATRTIMLKVFLLHISNGGLIEC